MAHMAHLQAGWIVPAIAPGRRAAPLGVQVPTKPFPCDREAGRKIIPAIKGLGSNNGVSSYLPMTSPVNAAIYAFGGFMLFALAIGFFAAPV